MAKLVEMDERASIFVQMEENVGPVILINKFSVDPEEFERPRLRNSRSSQGSFRHNYTRALVVAVLSSTMQFGNLSNISRGQLIGLWTHRTECLHTHLVQWHLLTFSRKWQFQGSV
jgi:hypothetical protein